MKTIDPRQKKSNHLRELIVIAIATAVFLSVFGVVLFQTTKGTMASQLGVTAQGMANAVARVLMDDTESYLLQGASQDTDSAYYQDTQEYLQTIISGSNVEYLFVEVRTSSEEVVHVVGSDSAGGPFYRVPGSISAIDSARSHVYSTKQPHSTELLQDPSHRQWVTAYAPILNEDNKVLGLVGAEVGAGALFLQMINRVAWIVLVCMILFTMAAYFVIRVAPEIIAMIICDDLTGAYNKRHLKRVLSRQMQKAKRSGAALSVLLVDIDNLEEINDKYGPSLGDVALRYFSMRVMNALRQNDCCARYDSGTFVIVLPNTSVGMSSRVGERIRHIAENYKIQQVSAQHSVNVTVSIGGAGLCAHSSATHLLNDANLALQKAKETQTGIAVLEQGVVVTME